jgi:hypothetical protein
LVVLLLFTAVAAGLVVLAGAGLVVLAGAGLVVAGAGLVAVAAGFAAGLAAGLVFACAIAPKEITAAAKTSARLLKLFIFVSF